MGMKKNGYEVSTFVRWMGAYGHHGSLEESIRFELSRKATDEVACEGICGFTNINHCRVGLLVNPKNIVLGFNGDCYSVKENNGKLKKTRNPRHSGHVYAECFAKIGRNGKNAYIGIVIKGFGAKSANLDNLSMDIRKCLMSLSKEFKLPIYTLKNGSGFKNSLKRVF